MATKTEKNLAKAAKARRKDEQRVARKARGLMKDEAKKEKADKKGKQGGRIKAAQQFRKASDNLFGLPPILWPFVLLVCYQMVRNALEKDQQKRDLEEAKRFLYESRGFR